MSNVDTAAHIPPVVEEPAVAPATAPPAVEAPETFDREYVEKLRKEAAGYRTKAKDYEDAFGGYNADEQKYLLDLTRRLSDPTSQVAAAKEWKEVVEAIESRDGKARPDGKEDPAQQPLTRAEYEAMRDEERKQADDSKLLESIQKEAADLGYKPDSREYAQLMFELLDPEVAGDMKKAHERIEGSVKSLKDKVIADYRKEVEANAGRWPGGAEVTTPVDQSEAPKDWKDARAAVFAKLAGKAGVA